MVLVLCSIAAAQTPAPEAVAPMLPTFTVLHNFASAPSDGADPSSPLILANDGSYYGLAEIGGAFNRGAVYKLAPDGSVSLVYSFTGGADGSDPMGAMALDEEGNLYGATFSGGDPGCGVVNGCGVVFKLAPDGTQTVLHAFSGIEGASPQTGLVRDADGNLYGTAQGGGDMSCSDSIAGCGVAFKVAPDGTYTLLHAFSVSPAGSDAAYPSPLLRDGVGNLYGTVTYATGPSGNSDGIFKLEPDGTYTILFTFSDYTTQGRNPTGGLVGDPAGNLYGVTFSGGAYNQGVAYRLAANGAYTVLHAFTNGDDGRNPSYALYRNPRTGLLYGTAADGGSRGCGTVFVLNPKFRERLRTLYEFTCTGAAYPVNALIKGQGRELIGTAFIGSTVGGAIYRLQFGE